MMNIKVFVGLKSTLVIMYDECLLYMFVLLLLQSCLIFYFWCLFAMLNLFNQSSLHK